MKMKGLIECHIPNDNYRDNYDLIFGGGEKKDEVGEVGDEVIKNECDHYTFQEDRNGDVAIEFCNHPNNSNKHEGNCTHTLCPVTGKPSEEFS